VEPSGEVFGDTPNTAARVQSVAGPGSILITAAVQRQTAGLFVAEDRRQHDIKGVDAQYALSGRPGERRRSALGDPRRGSTFAHGLDRRHQRRVLGTSSHGQRIA
jgi:class 3 adenylate cyclase